MLLRVLRSAPDGQAIRGHLLIQRSTTIDSYGNIVGVWEPFCATLERKGVEIPELWYRLVVTRSPKFHRLLPLLEAVPGRSGIRIHCGTIPQHSSGCILVPPAKEKGLTDIILAAQRAGEEIRIEITHCLSAEDPVVNEEPT